MWLAPARATDAKPETSFHPAEHLILISIDGFNPQWYQDESWPAPFLQRMAAEGAYAKRVRPPFPSLTRPGHVTILTGLLPARHGVYNNSRPYRLPEGGSLIHAVHASGGVTAGVVWPGSGHGPLDHSVRNLPFIDFSAADSVPPGEALINRADADGRGGHSRDYERYIAGTLRDAQMMAMGVTFIERHKPNLLLLRFNDTDRTQHRYGRNAAAVRGIVASTNMGLMEIAAAVERAGIADRTVVIVTGDHGMDDVHTFIRPNVWLAEAGFGGGEGAAHFETYGGSAFLRGADAAKAAEIRSLLESKLADDPMFTIFSRERLDEIGADPQAVFALSAAPGYAFSHVREAPAKLPVPLEGRHGSFPTPEAPNNYTGFVAWGAGIEPGTVFEEIDLQDVAPTAAALLGIDFPEADGRSRAAEFRGRE